MKNWITKNKGIIIVAAAALIVAILLRVVSQKSPSGTSNQSVGESSPTPSDYVPPKYVQTPDEKSLDPQKVKDSIENRKRLAKELPIRVNGFRASNGMETSIVIYSLSNDPDYLIHVDIYQIDYENQDANPKSNPNVTAFIDSFEEVKKLLSSRGVDLSKMYFVSGTREYINETVQLWIKTFKLL